MVGGEFASTSCIYAAGGVVDVPLFPAFFVSIVAQAPEDGVSVAGGVAEGFVRVLDVGEQFAGLGVDAVLEVDALGAIGAVGAFVDAHPRHMALMLYMVGSHNGIGVAVQAVLCLSHRHCGEDEDERCDSFFHGVKVERAAPFSPIIAWRL